MQISRQKLKTAALIIAIFAVLGIAVLARSQAAGFILTPEAESGTVQGNAVAADVSGASAGKAVKFGTGTAGTEFGFLVGYDSNNPDWPALRSDIDMLAANGQKWMRIGVSTDLISADGDVNNQQWDAAGLKLYDDAFNYARQKGLKVIVTSAGAPWWATDLSYADYKKASAGYVGYIAQRWKNQIDIYQVLNEVDSSHYQTFDSLPYDLTPAYLQEVDGILAEARRVVKAANPNITITTNSSGYPVTEEIQGYYFKFFDAIHDNLDIISLDPYPDGNDESVVMAAQRVTDAKRRYNKPVSVAEIGMPTCTGCYTDADVANYMPKTINLMKQAGAAHIIYYELRDSGTDQTDGESVFGLLKYDGTKKGGFQAVMNAMR